MHPIVSWGTIFGQAGYLCVGGEGGVASHEVVESGGGDEGRNQTNQIIVHVARVTQGGGTGGHYCGNLKQLGYTELAQ